MSEQIVMSDVNGFEDICLRINEIESFLDKEVSVENIMYLIQTFFTEINELIRLEIIHTLEILSSCITDSLLKTMINCFLDSNYVVIESNTLNHK